MSPRGALAFSPRKRVSQSSARHPLKRDEPVGDKGDERMLGNRVARLCRTASTVGCAPTAPEIFRSARYLVRSPLMATSSRSVVNFALMQSLCLAVLSLGTRIGLPV